MLADRDDVTVVGEASSLEEASPLLVELEPDVVLAAAGAEWPNRLVPALDAQASDSVPLVLLGGDPTPAELASLLHGPVRGLLSADATGDEIAATLASVAQGMLVIEPRIGRALIATLPAPETQTPAAEDEPLTEREQEVLGLVALGLPNKTIAARLHISEHTVKFHVGSILAKLDAGSRTEAVTRAARRGLLTL
jgi:DNA-binding NarL/FixJ family response regulator